MATAVDIDDIPTMVVPRSDGGPPIILYHISPPSYNQAKNCTLLDSGPPITQEPRVIHQYIPNVPNKSEIVCIRMCVISVLVVLIAFLVFIITTTIINYT